VDAVVFACLPSTRWRGLRGAHANIIARRRAIVTVQALEGFANVSLKLRLHGCDLIHDLLASIDQGDDVFEVRARGEVGAAAIGERLNLGR